MIGMRSSSRSALRDHMQMLMTIGAARDGGGVTSGDGPPRQTD